MEKSMDTNISQYTVNKMVKWRKQKMKKEKIKNVFLFIVCVLGFYAFMVYMFHIADVAYENRAKNAGYELPIEQQRR